MYFSKVLSFVHYKLDAFGKAFSKSDFDSYISYISLTTDDEINVDWNDIKSSLIKEGYSYCSSDDSILSKGVLFKNDTID